MSNVLTIGGIVDQVIELIEERSDDSSYSSELIYAILLNQRNLLLYRELDKNKKISKHLYKTICMPLEKSSQIPCDCLPTGLGCEVLKSKYKLPKPLKTSMYELIQVLTLDGLVEYTYRDIKVGKYNKYRVMNANKPYYTIYNDYLYLIGYPNNDLAAILIEMIPEDPCALDDISLCDTNGTPQPNTCFDPQLDTFNIDGHLIAPMIDLTLQKLNLPLQIQEDIQNDASIPSTASVKTR